MSGVGMGELDGRVALITGAARGQGRSHAVRLAAAGADTIAIDCCRDIASVPYPLATPADLVETARQVGELGRRVVAAKIDVRDADGLTAGVADAVAELGRLDVVCANAGVGSFTPAERIRTQQWVDMIDVNLSGVWFTVKAALPAIRASGRGGSIIIVSSVAGLRGYANGAHYAAAKHGVVGMMKALANELGPDHIRVNTIHPTSVLTPMVNNESTRRLFDPSGGEPDQARVEKAFTRLNVLPVPWIEASDVSNLVLWLASDQARYVTGATVAVDAGASERTA